MARDLPKYFIPFFLLVVATLRAETHVAPAASTGQARASGDATWAPRFDSQGSWNAFCEKGKEGLDQILNGYSMETRIPAKLFVQAVQKRLFPKSGKEQYEKLGLTPSPPDRNEKLRKALGLGEGVDIPLGLSLVDDAPPGADKTGSLLDNKFIVFNCFLCHSGMRANQVVLGASNPALRSGAFASLTRSADLVSASVLQLPASMTKVTLTKREAEAVRGGLAFNRKFFLPSLSSAAEQSRLGNNFGYAVDWLQMAALRETPRFPFEMSYGESAGYHELKKAKTPPVLPFPWFIHGAKEGYDARKPSSYRYAEPRRFPSPMNFSVVPELPAKATREQVAAAAAERKAHEGRIDRIWGLFDCLPTPKYPFPVDQKKAEKGCSLFNEQVCASCHGKFAQDTVSKRWSVTDYQPGRLVNIRTDPRYSAYVAGAKKLVPKSNGAVEGEKDERRTAVQSFRLSGGQYTPPPLVGLWSRSPFLHNGSVPTVYDLITPPGSTDPLGAPRRAQKGQTKYYRLSDPNQYDKERLGAVWEEISRKDYDEARKNKQTDPARYFSTADFGLSNAGHPFYIEKYEDRMAVIECFKLLSGDNLSRSGK